MRSGRKTQDDFRPELTSIWQNLVLAYEMDDEGSLTAALEAFHNLSDEIRQVLSDDEFARLYRQVVGPKGMDLLNQILDVPNGGEEPGRELGGG